MFGGSGCSGLLELPLNAEASPRKVAARASVRAARQPRRASGTGWGCCGAVEVSEWTQGASGTGWGVLCGCWDGVPVGMSASRTSRLQVQPQRRGAATMQRIPSAACGNSRNPLHPEPPRMQPPPRPHGTPTGVRGKNNLIFPPAALRRFRRAKAATRQQ